MAIKPRINTVIQQQKVDNFISRGGKSPELEGVAREMRGIMLYLPKSLIEKIDENRKKKQARISRNLWIVDKIERALEE